MVAPLPLTFKVFKFVAERVRTVPTGRLRPDVPPDDSNDALDVLTLRTT